jgi:hypothetical protein
MACLSPSHSTLKRSRSIYEESLLPSLMQQEKLHARSKRPRVRFAAEADIKIQSVIVSVQEILKRVQSIEFELTSLESKVDKLDLEREQPRKEAFLSKFCPGSPNPHEERDSTKVHLLTPRSPAVMFVDSGIEMSGNSSSSEDEAAASTCSKVAADYLKRMLLDVSLHRSWGKVKTEADILQTLFSDNFGFLKFKRAESCLLRMIKLQRKLKNLGDGYSQLRVRLMQFTGVNV